MDKKYWLMKSEPDVFSITDLKNSPKKTVFWEGVRNYQARNFMRDEMRKGDEALFYHSNCQEPGVVGIMEISREAYPDHTAEDEASPYYHPRSVGKNKWVMVDVTWRCTFTSTVSLSEIKITSGLENMKIVQKGNRLSITPVSKSEFEIIRTLGIKS